MRLEGSGVDPEPHQETVDIPQVSSMKAAIRAELRRRQTSLEGDLLGQVLRGQVDRTLTDLLYFSLPADFERQTGALLDQLSGLSAHSPGSGQRHALLFSVDLAIQLRSFLPRWNLGREPLQGAARLPEERVAELADQAEATAVRLARADPGAEQALLARWRDETARRFRAEAAADPEAEAAAFVGGSAAAYLASLSAAIGGSNLRRIAEMHADGRTPTEVSNDYAAFLDYAMLIGASFVTCNPPLVDLAWQAEPRRWDPVIDRLLVSRPEADGEDLARHLTLEIVLANMRLLRPIFLLTEGQAGCVCLQVNPKAHGEAASMLAEAQGLYRELQARLDGGVPNVVFKLPGTRAGLEACRALTGQGVGVTITVNFGLFQHLPFAEAIDGGQALFSTLAHMSGRLAYPVRDELLALPDELAQQGIDGAQARWAAAWSGVAVFKRLYAVMAQRGYDLGRIKPLIASLRVYEGPAYAELPGPCPDITEALGAGVITVFPNVRRAFDAFTDILLEPQRILAPVPEPALRVLAHSELFKQAYDVAGPEAAGPAEPRFRPQRPLSLDDEGAVAEWPPVRSTLSEFCKAYDAFVERILQRREAVRERRIGDR